MARHRFVNLYRDNQLSADFIAHNYAISEGRLYQTLDPGDDVEVALRSGGIAPDAYLISRLTFTMSEACCRSFLQQHRGTPIEARDYLLSKLYQIFVKSLLDECNDLEYYQTVPGMLESALESAFPVGCSLEGLSKLDWHRILRSYSEMGLESLITSLPSFIIDAGASVTLSSAETRQVRLDASRAVGETIGAYIDRRRESMSIEALAEKADLNATQIYRLKSGEEVTNATVRKVAKALKCSVADLIESP